MERGFGLFLIIFFLFVGIYFVWSIGGKLLNSYFIERDETIVPRARKQCISIAIAVILLIALMTICIAMSFVIMRPDIDEKLISRNNNYLMEIDHSIFGVYPPIWLQQSDNALKPMIDKLVPFLIVVYYSLVLVLDIALFILFFFKTRLCIQFICAFFLCAIISMPFWYLFPSISPMIAYFEPILFQDISTNVESALHTYSPLPQLEQALQSSVEYRSSVRDTSLIVTTIPSMHIAWSFLVVFYLIAFSRVLALVVVPFFILNSLSTIITMHHYAIDTLGGILVAIVAIFITKIISERTIHIFDPIVLLVQDDVKSVRKWIRESIRR